MNSRHKVFYSQNSGLLLLKIPPKDVGMFRFLLESRDNLALFTVLDPGIALLKMLFAPESRESLIKALQEIKIDLEIEWQEWPCQRRN